ncbi:Inverted formin-2 [Merluccius polli]|uniref:Inverted formin-2 n=1 Tax=Merluccius polli TaxID=89951 RepID=A0AA47MPQ7_MERPO|nr:Inverted formin-2 [Merluccius polli]
MAARKWSAVKVHVTSGSPDAADAQLEANLEDADPELCIRLLQIPTVVNYSGLRRRLESSDRTWMVQFLELRGLDLLMEALDRVSGRGCARIADALLQLTCVACVRAIMNSPAGLHFILDHHGYVRTLAQALDTSNVMVKMQVFELLAAVTLFDHHGHRLILDALEHYKSLKKQRYRFSVIMNELHATDNVAYMVTLMSVVNVLLVGLDDLRKRDKLRKEFIGLQLLDLLPRLRDTEDTDLNIQCEAFEDSLAEDEEEMMKVYGGVDMSSHQDVFTSLFTRVSSTPASLHLLSVLQALLLVSPDRAEVWRALETLVDRATLLAQDAQLQEESAEQLLFRLLPSKALRPPVSTNQMIPTTNRAVQTDSLADKSQPLCITSSTPSSTSSTTTTPWSWRRSFTSSTSSSTTTPWPWRSSTSSSSSSTTTPWPWRSPTSSSTSSSSTWFGSSPASSSLWSSYSSSSPRRSGDDCTPRSPRAVCRSLPHPPHEETQLAETAGPETWSMWTSVPQDPLEPDYSSIEQLFALPQTDGPAKGNSTPAKPKEISFIDSKKNLNLHIFLKQFRCSHEDFVGLIHTGDRTKFDTETLKQLLKLLPEKHEVENLRAYQGERDQLADVDRFYLLLLAVPCYSLRIECMLLSEETSCVLENLMPKAQLVENACKGLKHCPRLLSFCKLILDIGNFLNYGSHTGNAEGFKINTLLKLTETKANKSRLTLLHYIIEVAEQKHPDMLKLPDDLELCDKAAGVNLESIQSEAAALVRFLENTKKKVAASSAEDLKKNYLSTIEGYLDGCRKLQEMFTSVEEEKRMLAVYLCEDPSKLSLQEVFSTLQTFRALFIKAYKENHSRQEQALRVERRRKQQEEEESKHPKGENGKPLRKTVPVQEDCIIDKLLADIRKGFCLRKTRAQADRETLPPAGRTENSRRPESEEEPQTSSGAQIRQNHGPPQLPQAPEPLGVPEPEQCSDNPTDHELESGSTLVLSLSDLPQRPSPSPPTTPTLTADPRPASITPDSGLESSPGRAWNRQAGRRSQTKPDSSGSEDGPEPSTETRTADLKRASPI